MRRIAALSIMLFLLNGSVAVEAQVARPGPDSPWLIAPAFFPRGALINFVSGDPHLAMPVQVDLAFPDGYRMPPHSHAQEIHVLVLKGELAVGVGQRMNMRQTKTLAAGDTVTVAAARPHYWIARGGETVISVTAMGPLLFTYVQADQDPSRHTPFGN